MGVHTVRKTLAPLLEYGDLSNMLPKRSDIPVTVKSLQWLQVENKSEVTVTSRHLGKWII
jgi:hypothetical protein